MARIGIDLGGTKIEGILLSAAGSPIRRMRLPTPAGDYAATLTAVVELVQQLEQGCGEACSVGVGTPGALSRRTGRLRNANSTCLNGSTIDRDLAELLGREVRIANDADCFALSEAVDGAAAGARCVFGVILGTGTGGGIVVDGRLLAGPNAIAGEWGHNPLPWPRDDERPGPACYCGKRGCIETFLSGPGLAYDHDPDARCDARTVAGLAEAGDPAALATLRRYTDRLARALAGVINILDPDVIVLGGGLSKLKQLYTAVPRIWQQYVFCDAVDTQLVAPLHGDSSGVRGAAWLWPDCG